MTKVIFVLLFRLTGTPSVYSRLASYSSLHVHIDILALLGEAEEGTVVHKRQ